MLDFWRMVRRAQLELLSRYDSIELAEKVLGELAQGAMEEETRYWVGMAMREALANAIKHGNKLNPEKRVLVSMQVSEEQVVVEVEDEGEGFDPEALPNPCAPENLLRSSGRGVFYMRHFMDEVRFVQGEQGGTRLRLVKHLRKEKV